MPKKETKQGLWKTVAYCVLCALGVYLLLQFLNAALVAREVVGEAQALMLVWATAGIAVFVGVLVMGRACRTGRMLLGAGSAAGLAAVVLLCTLASGGDFSGVGKQLAGTAAAAVVGGVLAALIATPGKGRKAARKRR